VSLNDSSNTPLYQVGLDPVSGKFSGYGWSENGGWVDFAPTTGYPTGPGTDPSNAHGAQIDPNCTGSCPVTGWIRFVAGENPTLSDTGGWDGWVSLSGKNPAYGVMLNTTTGVFSGMAWGDKDTGWIDFSGAKTDASTCQDSNAANFHQSLPCVCDGVGQYAGNTYSYTYVPPICSYPQFNGTPTQATPGGLPNPINQTYTQPPQFTGTPTQQSSSGGLPNPTSQTYGGGGIVQATQNTNQLPGGSNISQYGQSQTTGGGNGNNNNNGMICVSQTVYPSQCAPQTSTCYDNTTKPPTPYTYPTGTTPPSQCNGNGTNVTPPPNPLSYCIDHKTGKLVSYPSGTTPPAGCTPTTCTAAFQINGIGPWYGPVNGGPQNGGTCNLSACPKNISMGFVATIPTGYVMDSTTGMCVPIGTNTGGPGSTVPINPNYKEQ